MEIEKYVGWELLAKAPMDPVYFLSQVYIYFLYSSDIITYYYVPHVYNFMLFVYVINIVSCTLNKLNWIEYWCSSIFDHSVGENVLYARFHKIE